MVTAFGPAKPQRNHACDGLRAVALLGVVAFHVWPTRMPGGYFGVNVFFVLAGFFVSQKMFDSILRTGYFDLSAFYRQRLLRLYRPLIPFLIVVSLWTYCAQPGVYLNVQQAIPSVLFFYNNTYQLLGDQSYFATHGSFQPFTHMWALALELQFYLLYPLLILCMHRLSNGRWRKTGAALLGFSILSAILMAIRYQPGADPTPVYYSLSCRLFAFTLGGAAAFYYLATPLAESLRAIPGRLRNLFAVFCLAVIVGTFFFMGYQSSFTYQGGMFLYSLITSFFILLVYPGDLGVGKLLSSRCLLALSRRSYSYYLWQHTLLVLGDSWFAFSTTPIALRHLLHFALLLLTGEISYRLFERLEFVFPRKVCRRLLTVASLLLLILLQVSLRPIIAETPPLSDPQPVGPDETDIGDTDVGEDWHQLRLIAIGDSVLGMARDQLSLQLPVCTIDAKISRQIGQGVEVLQALQGEGIVGDAFLISLGTNGDFRENVLDQYRQLADGKPLIFMTTVMPDSWEQSVNRKLHQYAATHPGVYLVDWYAAAKTHPEWFYSDGTHPKPEGVQQLVDLILQQLELVRETVQAC